MSYRNLLVHVEPTEFGRERLRLALALARVFESRLIGIGARALSPMLDPIGVSIVKLKEDVESGLAGAEVLFREETAPLGGSRRVWHAHVGFPTEVLLRHAAAADLIIVNCNVEGGPEETQAGTADLMMSSGLPVLATPLRAKFDLKRILIGWKDTREARRAVGDALPFIRRAAKVHLLSFDSDAAGMSDVVTRLRMHDVTVEAETRSPTLDSVAEDILAAADTLDAGLIVVGGYGHSRLHEWALGGVTQGLLTHSRRPLLFSH